MTSPRFGQERLYKSIKRGLNYLGKKKNIPKNKKQTISKKRLKILKWTSLLVLMVGGIALFLLSDLFNIKEIKVLNNSKITSLEIENLSDLQINQNMFKFLEITVEEKIKQNPYIESVDIRRRLNRYN